MIYLNTILFNGAYSEKIDNWFDSQFYNTFKTLENLFIKNCLEIDVKNKDENYLKRSIQLLQRLPTKSKANQIVSEANYVLASKINGDDEMKSTLLKLSLEKD